MLALRATVYAVNSIPTGASQSDDVGGRSRIRSEHSSLADALQTWEAKYLMPSAVFFPDSPKLEAPDEAPNAAKSYKVAIVTGIF